MLANMNKVLDGLFIGSIDAAHDTLTLKKNGITHILTACSDFQPPNIDVPIFLSFSSFRNLFGKDLTY